MLPAAATAAPCGNGRERCISHKGLAKMDKKAGKKARRLINVIINKGVSHWKVDKLESRLSAAMQEKVLDILVMYACKCKGPSDCPKTFDKAYECYTPGKLAALQKNAPGRHASILADEPWMVQVEPTRDMSDAEFTTMKEKFQQTIDDANNGDANGGKGDPGNPLWGYEPKAGAKSEDGRDQLDLNPTDVMVVEKMLADPNSDLNKEMSGMRAKRNQRTMVQGCLSASSLVPLPHAVPLGLWASTSARSGGHHCRGHLRAKGRRALRVTQV